MEKKNFFPLLIGIFISINTLADDATQNAIYERLGQVLDEASQNRAINETHNSNFRSFVSQYFQPMAQNVGSSMSYLNLINSVVQNMTKADGGSGTWFFTMYQLALDMKEKYNQLVSDLDDLYEHISTTQNYQLEDIKTSNQTISENTTSIKDTAKNIEASTDVIEGHTETIASDTTSINDLLTKNYTINMYRAIVAPSRASLDLHEPDQRTTQSISGNVIDQLVNYFNYDSHIQASQTMVQLSELMNLQSIRTNLNHIADLIASNTNTVRDITVDQLPDITADLLPEYGINASTHDLPNVQANFTGDFHNDLLKLTRFNASVNISASYAAISILTNIQSFLSRNADQKQAELTQQLEDGIDSVQKEADGVEDYIESQQSSWGEHFTFKNENARQHLESKPALSQLSTDEMPQYIGFTINDIKLTDDSVTRHLVVEHELTAEERAMLRAIRSCCTFLVWGVGVFASLWLYLMFIRLLGWACSLINPWAFNSGANNNLQLSSY